MRIDRKKAYTLFASTLLFTSLLLVNMNFVGIGGVEPPEVLDVELYPRRVVDLEDPTDTQWHELHPSITNYYHLMSWEPGRVLSPEDQIDMYLVDPPVKVYVETEWVDPFNPWSSEWHEISPTFCQWWIFTSWEDNGDDILSPCDQIDMKNTVTGDVVWFHVQQIIPPDPIPGPKMMHLDVKYWFQVDEVTVDMTLLPEVGEKIFVEYKCGYWTFDPENPICTKWNEIDPELGPTRCLHLTSWEDNGNGVLDPGDVIDMTPLSQVPGQPPGPAEYYQVVFISISLKLTPKESPPVVPPPPKGPVYLESMVSYDEFDLSNPVCTPWHEIYPVYSRTWHLSSWENFYGLSPCDQIVLALKDEDGEPIPGTEAEYHVDKLTVAMNLTSMYDGITHIVKFEESLKQFKQYHWHDPESTQWHEVNPVYCRQWHLYLWMDNGDGLLGWCDYIYMVDKHTGWVEEFHVESLSTDMWLTLKVTVEEHDVAVTAVSSLYPWVYQGEIDPISVTITNLGDFDEPTVDVYAYYDGNLAAPKQTTSLLIGQTKTLTFNWNTTGVPPAVYTISAKAVIPIDDHPGNNVLTDGTQEVKEPPYVWDQPYVEVQGTEDFFPAWHAWWVRHGSTGVAFTFTKLNASRIVSEYVDVEFNLGITNHMDGERGLDGLLDVVINPAIENYRIRNVLFDNLDPTNHVYYMTTPSGTYETKAHITIHKSFIHGGNLTVKLLRHIDDPAINDPATECTNVPICLGTQEDPTPIIPLNVYENDDPHTVHINVVTDINGTIAAPGEVVMRLQWLAERGTGPTPEPPIHLHGEPLVPVHVHAEYLIDLYDPICTYWWELYPRPDNGYHLTSWEDNGDELLSPCDQIDMTDMDTEEVTWWHVDRVTVTLLLYDGRDYRTIEFEGNVDPLYSIIKTPKCTYWHEITPTYCRRYHLVDWADTNQDGQLSYCDWIVLQDRETQEYIECHIEGIATDLVLNKKITNPKCTYWHELYPEYCNWYHLTSWEDTGEPFGFLSPSDQIDMIDMDTERVDWYHVEEVTLTLFLSPLEPGYPPIFIEYEGGFETMYQAKINPVCTYWHEAYPMFSRRYHLTSWEDNGNGVLSFCDIIDLTDVKTQEKTYWHVEEVSIDIIVKRKLPYCEYVWDQPSVEVQGTHDFIPGWPGWWVRLNSTGVAFTFTNIDPSKIVSEYLDITFNLGITNRMNGEEGLDGLLDVSINPAIENYLIPNVLFDNLDPTNHIYYMGSGIGTYLTKAHITVHKSFIHNGELTIKVLRHTDRNSAPTAQQCTEKPISLGTQDDPTPIIPTGVYENDDPHTVHIGFMTDATGTIAAPGVVVMRLEWLTVLGVHDIAVTAVETFKTVCAQTFHPINIVYQNYTVSINATVENKGDFDETFDVTAKYNGNTIQTILNLFLPAHTSTNVTFTWNTIGVTKGNYTISVEAEVLPGETNTTNNNYPNGWVVVTWLGDTDGDLDVDQFDFWGFCGAFIDYYTIHVKDPYCDFDDDCDIDQFDFWTFCGAFIDYYNP